MPGLNNATASDSLGAGAFQLIAHFIGAAAANMQHAVMDHHSRLNAEEVGHIPGGEIGNLFAGNAPDSVGGAGIDQRPFGYNLHHAQLQRFRR